MYCIYTHMSIAICSTKVTFNMDPDFGVHPCSIFIFDKICTSPLLTNPVNINHFGNTAKAVANKYVTRTNAAELTDRQLDHYIS